MNYFKKMKYWPSEKVLTCAKTPRYVPQTTPWGTNFPEVAGFTLLEVIVTLAILGVLVSFAYPSYQSSVTKTRRSDGIGGVLIMQVAQERFRANCPFFAENIGTSNVCGISAASSTVQAGNSSHDGYYTLSIVRGTASADSYTILAMPQGTQAKDTGCAPLIAAFSSEYPNGLRTPASCW
jgi:type IV pilus assembly protein PilE